MNDLKIVREFRDEPQPIEPAALLRARSALVREMHRTDGRSPGLSAKRTRVKSPRFVWSVALSVGLALEVGGVYLAQPHDVRGSDRGATSVPVAGATSGAQILHNAALVADKQPIADPRPDQFVFTESVSAGNGIMIGPDGKATTKPGVPQLRQVWNSVDGTRDGLIKGRAAAAADWSFIGVTPVCRDGRMPLVGKDGKLVPGKYEAMNCRTVPAFLPDLPTDADAMLNWLYTKGEVSNINGPERVQAAFYSGYRLIESYCLTAPVKAALFEALSRLPGTTVQTDEVDLAGRHGVTVSIASTPSPAASSSVPPAPPQLIFDAKTYAFLGTPKFAVLRQGIVDEVGQLSA